MKILFYTGKYFTILISKLVFRIKTSGQENIPKSGGFILASNHISFYDPPLVGAWINREVYFMAKKELFKNRIIGNIVTRCNSLPVTRRGFDREAIELCLNVINQGYGLTIFPEGTRSLTDDFLPPKPGIGMIALQAKCPIVPVYIQGSNRFADCFWGKQKLRITYGEPFTCEWLSMFPPEKESYLKITQAVMDRIGQLKENLKS